MKSTITQSVATLPCKIT